jgi:hypothetical protein
LRVNREASQDGLVRDGEDDEQCDRRGDDVGDLDRPAIVFSVGVSYPHRQSLELEGVTVRVAAVCRCPRRLLGHCVPAPTVGACPLNRAPRASHIDTGR